MKNLASAVAMSLVGLLLVVPGLARADSGSDDECGSSAKSIFANAGKLQSDGGQRHTTPQAARADFKPSDRPAIRTCQPKPNPSAPTPGAAVPSALPPVERHAGLALWAEALQCGAATSHRTTTYRFKTGECAKLFFMPNTDGFLYVANVDSANRVDFLFPQRGESNQVLPGVPASFGVEFVGIPGVERVFVFFSKTKIADVPNLAIALAGRMARRGGGEDDLRVMLTNTRGQATQSKSLRRTDETVSATRPDAARYFIVSEVELVGNPIMALNLDLVHTSP